MIMIMIIIYLTTMYSMFIHWKILLIKLICSQLPLYSTSVP